MKNKEKYYEEILEAFFTVKICEFAKAHIFKKNDCDGVRCSQCEEKLRQWLEAEYVEPIRLTRNEKAILESLPKEYKWIARDSNYNLDIYNARPHKHGDCWYDAGAIKDFYFFNHLFQFIKWSDEEPYSIEELLKCEVISDEN